MYENGIRVKGYAKKRLHKRKLKKQFLVRGLWSYPQYKSYEDYQANHKGLFTSEFVPDKSYWQRWYLTGSRQLAKDQTNRKLRRYFRDTIQKAEYDTLPACRGADYQKYYDYMWTIW